MAGGALHPQHLECQEPVGVSMGWAGGSGAAKFLLGSLGIAMHFDTWQSVCADAVLCLLVPEHLGAVKILIKQMWCCGGILFFTLIPILPGCGKAA